MLRDVLLALLVAAVMIGLMVLDMHTGVVTGWGH